MITKKYILECTEEQLDDLKSALDYLINIEYEHYNEWLEESDGTQGEHIYTMAVNASNITYKEMK